MSPKQPPSVTVLCGFLGAGKTTLLQHVLKQADGRLIERAEGAGPQASGSREQVATRVFRESAPFGAEKLGVFLTQSRAGVVRAKGFYWVAERPSDMSYLSFAGGVVRREDVGTWAAALLERGVISREEIPESARAGWAEPHGDRRQELVFIGAGFDAAALRAELATCLAPG